MTRLGVPGVGSRVEAVTKVTGDARDTGEVSGSGESTGKAQLTIEVRHSSH